MKIIGIWKGNGDVIQLFESGNVFKYKSNNLNGTLGGKISELEAIELINERIKYNFFMSTEYRKVA